MKIAFIIPNYELVSEEKLELYGWEGMREYKARKKLWSTPHLGLLTVAGMMPDGIEVAYFDLNYTKEITKDFDWAFLSPSTCQAVQAYSLAKKLRSEGIKVAMGGVHVSVLPDEALKHVDTVMIGEAENIIFEFIRDILNHRHKKIYKSTFYADIKSTPLPKYELVKNYNYSSIPIQLSRGCPHQCNFCISSKIHGKKIRRKTIKQTAAEIEHILENKPKAVLFFTDDNLLLDETFGHELLCLLKEYHIRWYGFSDASIGRKDNLLEKLYDSGCMQLLIGFESLQTESLEWINRSQWKKNKRQDYQEIISNIQSYGIGIVGSFVLGIGNENEDYFKQLYDFIFESKIYATNLTMLTPFPGTEVFDILKEQNRILTYDWKRYNGFEITVQPTAMTVFEMEEQYIELNKKINSEERNNMISESFVRIFRNRQIG